MPVGSAARGGQEGVLFRFKLQSSELGLAIFAGDSGGNEGAERDDDSGGGEACSALLLSSP